MLGRIQILFCVAALAVACGRPGLQPGGVATLSVNALPGLQVTSDVGSINCPPECTETYSAGTTVRLDVDRGAVCAPARWSAIGCSGDSCAVTLTTDTTVNVDLGDAPWLWTRSLGGGQLDSVQALALDAAAGRLFAVGSASTGTDFGGGAITTDADDAFVASFTTGTGMYVQAATYGAANEDVALDVVVDSAASRLVTIGRYASAFSIDGGANVVTSQGGTSDLFLAAIDYADGSFAPMWLQSFGTSGDEISGHLAANGTELFAVGATSDVGAMDLEGGSNLSDPGGTGDNDVFMARFNFDGQPAVWSQGGMGGDGDDRVMSVATYQGDPIMAGWVGASGQAANFRDLTRTVQGPADLYFATYDNGDGDGNAVLDSDGAADERVYDIAVDGGAIFVVGSFIDEINIGGAQTTSNAGLAAFVARFNSVGSFPVWVRYLDSAGGTSDRAVAIDIDAAGSLYVVGHYDGDVTDLDTATTISTVGGSDVFVWKLNQAGDTEYLEGYGSTNDELARDVVVLANGSVGVLALDTLGASSIDFEGCIATTAGPASEIVMAAFTP